MRLVIIDDEDTIWNVIDDFEEYNLTKPLATHEVIKDIIDTMEMIKENKNEN